MVYYRKYRPQKIDELDSRIVREKLLAVLGKTDSVPHAFLFTGPKGLGKTSAARIVAKAVNCTNRKKGSVEPCNKCSQCISISNGTNIDVLEIDGASNRGIDEIRDLREKVRLSPSTASKKVYIIDEVHMLTTEAFNALLKTLEEPPPHALFILATTEPHKVPPTIFSRCFHIAFQKATSEELVRSFTRIAKGEHLNVEKDALLYIATLSDGAFRDGAKILEETALLSGRKKITREFVEKQYKVSGITYYVSNMIDTLSEKDVKKGLKLISKIGEDGMDIKHFIEQMIEAFHQMLLVEVGVPIQNTKYKIQNTRLRIEEIKEVVELLTKAYAELKYAVVPTLPLEIAVVEWCGESSKLKVQSGKLEEKEGVSNVPNGEQDFWQQFTAQVKKHNTLLAGVLKSCSLKKYDGKTITISTKFKFHGEKLESSAAILEQAGAELTGKPVKIDIQLE